MDVLDGQVQFLRDLFVGKIETHKVDAQHPCLERPVAALEYGVRQIVEAASASSALASPLMDIPSAKAPFYGSARIAKRASSELRPTQTANHLKAFFVTDQIHYVDLDLRAPFWKECTAFTLPR